MLQHHYRLRHYNDSNTKTVVEVIKGWFQQFSLLLNPLSELSPDLVSVCFQELLCEAFFSGSGLFQIGFC